MKKLLFIGLLVGLITGVIFSSRTCIAEEDGRFLPETSQEGLRNGMPVAPAGSIINEEDYVKGKFFVKVKSPSGNPELFDKVPAGDLFSATPELTEIAYTHNIKTEATKRLFTALLNSPKAGIRQAASHLKNTFLIEADTDDPAKLIEDLMKLEGMIRVERVPRINTYYVPDDYDAFQQWYLDKIEAEDAWEIYQANSGTSEVHIAIVDDAVKLDHEDLNFNLWVNLDEIPNNGIDDDGNTYIDDVNGYDVANGDGDPNPPTTATNSYFHHGTHVAGIAAAVSNNNTGIASISGAGSNKVKIIAVKTKLDSSPGGSLEATFQGVEYAIAADADIINMSWGSNAYSHTFQDLFITAHSLGITLVAASGNSGSSYYSYPASYLYVISVGATTPSDQKAGFSNYGYQIDVMAPGVDILSTLPVNDNSYGNLSGTSMASPLVAGLCGLMLSYNDTLTPHQIEILLEENCDNIDAQNSGYIGMIGAGRINAENVLVELSLDNIPPDEDFTAINSNLTGLCWGNMKWGDYDNDGKLDILAVGWDWSAQETANIYHNDGLVNGQWQFTDINAQLEGVHYADAAWGDYDNDGYLDIALGGSTSNNQKILKIYHNDGLVNGQWEFTELSGSSLVGSWEPTLAWGDYDNDGKLDLAVIGPGAPPSIYHNDGLVNGQWHFTSFYISGVPSVYWGKFAWGDYDSDGRLDLAVTGAISPGNGFTKIYHNDGPGANGQWIFTPIDTSLINVGDSTLSWGDYNNDGRLDILLGGCDGGYPGPLVAKVYRNDGLVNGQWIFTDINAQLTGVYSYGNHLSWGDYDNDGDLDIVLSGKVSPSGGEQHYIAEVYINNNGVFTKTENELIGIGVGPVIWGDYDNDGKLDIASFGQIDGGSFPFVPGARTQIYHNNTLIANSIPNVPSSPQANVLDNDVTLSWQKATDTETLQDGLNYNIFIGTGSGLVDIASPMAQLSDGLRRIPAIGSQSQNTSWTINSLANGIYYWGVQAIDTAFAGSPFALGTFTIGNPTTWDISGMVTLDGVGLGGIELYDDTNTKRATTRQEPQEPVGYYEILGLPSGVPIEIAPYDVAYTFNPTHRPYTGSTGNQENQDYVATLREFTISGDITGLQSNNTYPVYVTATGANGSGDLGSAEGTNGSYTFYNVPYGWEGELSASSVAYDFTPPEITIPTVTADVTDQDFAATIKTFAISGTVKNNFGQIIPNATLTATGSPGTVNVPIVDGNYSYDADYGWTVTLTPSAPGYDFEPVSETFTNITSVQTQDFVGTLQTFTIEGTVSGLLPNNPYAVTIVATGTGNYVGDDFPATVNLDGSYSTGQVVPYGWEGELSASSVAYDFTPPEITIPTVTADVTDQDFEAELKEYTIKGIISGLMPGNTYTVTITAECEDTQEPWYVSVPNIPASDGNYDFTLPHGWEGKLIAQSPAYELKEYPEGAFTSPVTEHQEQNYTATLKKIEVSGDILGLIFTTVDPPHRITITAEYSNPPSQWYWTVIADATYGSYSMLLPYGWEGKLIAESPAYTLVEDPDVTFNSPVTEPQVQDYRVEISTVTISGTVYLEGVANKPIEGVTLTAKGWNGYVANVLTNSGGDYTIDVPYGFSGMVAPSKTGYTFDPENRSYYDVIANIDGDDYVGTNDAITHLEE